MHNILTKFKIAEYSPSKHKSHGIYAYNLLERTHNTLMQSCAAANPARIDYDAVHIILEFYHYVSQEISDICMENESDSFWDIIERDYNNHINKQTDHQICEGVYSIQRYAMFSANKMSNMEYHKDIEGICNEIKRFYEESMYMVLAASVMEEVVSEMIPKIEQKNSTTNTNIIRNYDRMGGVLH